MYIRIVHNNTKVRPITDHIHMRYTSHIQRLYGLQSSLQLYYQKYSNNIFRCSNGYCIYSSIPHTRTYVSICPYTTDI